MALGFQIFQRSRAVTEANAKRWLDLPVANVSDSMSRLSAAGANLTLMNTDLTTKMSGAALTVRTRPGDNLMVHKAIMMLEPGDVLVIDAGGDLSNAIIGEIMVKAAVSRGLGGLVVHGAIRDAETLRTSSLPVFACGVTHRGPYKDGPGEINAPVNLGGMIVHPGDLVLGDADGVVAVPFDHLDAIYDAARRKLADETGRLRQVDTNERDYSWIDRRLQAQGYKPEPTDGTTRS
ncbi:RraA family protein [Streptomyces scopuliridis]|uniref:RraA family protein n=1 Tax=Streptomyces scopuliridis TaxID=452529 RepID=A0ACD4ZW28_9ACTN|nr:RraA family protein [Streptomyces scopuliridis]WSB37517.1 RraA family protein [Streptomyces scopuliridis]WSC01993.1 RraA family protein [Streptomyces scopuliridis]WSC04470.1 RraA family protein [Streptomyces scopuliridis]